MLVVLSFVALTSFGQNPRDPSLAKKALDWYQVGKQPKDVYEELQKLSEKKRDLFEAHFPINFNLIVTSYRVDIGTIVAANRALEMQTQQAQQATDEQFPGITAKLEAKIQAGTQKYGVSRSGVKLVITPQVDDPNDPWLQAVRYGVYPVSINDDLYEDHQQYAYFERIKTLTFILLKNMNKQDRAYMSAGSIKLKLQDLERLYAYSFPADKTRLAEWGIDSKLIKILQQKYAVLFNQGNSVWDIPAEICKRSQDQKVVPGDKDNIYLNDLSLFFDDPSKVEEISSTQLGSPGLKESIPAKILYFEQVFFQGKMADVSQSYFPEDLLRDFDELTPESQTWYATHGITREGIIDIIHMYRCENPADEKNFSETLPGVKIFPGKASVVEDIMIVPKTISTEGFKKIYGPKILKNAGFLGIEDCIYLEAIDESLLLFQVKVTCFGADKNSFEDGQYHDDAIEPMIRLYTNWLGEYFQTFDGQMRLIIEATADITPIRNIIYNGKFGTILVENDQQKELLLGKGDRIHDNTTLAWARVRFGERAMADTELDKLLSGTEISFKAKGAEPKGEKYLNFYFEISFDGGSTTLK
jgi:hypothetical protein